MNCCKQSFALILLVGLIKSTSHLPPPLFPEFLAKAQSLVALRGVLKCSTHHHIHMMYGICDGWKNVYYLYFMYPPGLSRSK